MTEYKPETPLEHIANFLSYLIHPLFIPTFSLMAAMYFYPEAFNGYPVKVVKLSMMILFALTCLFPSLVFVLMKKLEIISDLDVRDKRQRIIPYLVALFFYLAAFLCFHNDPKKLYVNIDFVNSLVLGATISLGISFFLNNFLKVSLHSNGVGGFFAFSVLLSFYATKPIVPLVILAILMMALIGTSRIIIKAHTLREVIVGLLCGISGQIIAYKYYIH